MKRLVPIVLLAVLLCGCFSQPGYTQSEQNAYDAGYYDCLQEADIDAFDEYRHDEMVSYAIEYYKEDMIENDIDWALAYLSAYHPEEVLDYAAYLNESGETTDAPDSPDSDDGNDPLEEETDLPPEEFPDDVSVYVQTYVVNTSTGKFHYQSCPSVSQMKESNKRVVETTREQLVAEGYSPCGNCDP